VLCAAVFPNDFLTAARGENLRLMAAARTQRPPGGRFPGGADATDAWKGVAGGLSLQAAARLSKSRHTGLATAIRIGFWQCVRRGNSLPLSLRPTRAHREMDQIDYVDAKVALLGRPGAPLVGFDASIGSRNNERNR
jgi:hypothetical protein